MIVKCKYEFVTLLWGGSSAEFEYNSETCPCFNVLSDCDGLGHNK